MAGSRKKKKKRSPATRKQTIEPSPQPREGRRQPSRTSHIVFALGVGGLVVLLAMGVYESMRKDGRLPGVATAYMDYIEELFAIGEHEEALEQLHLARALDIVNEPLILNNLANAMQAQGKTAEAISYYHEAIRLKPDYAMAHYNLAKAVADQGDARAAITLYRRAVELDPDHVDSRNNLANLLSAQGDLEGAIEHYQHALNIESDAARTHNNLAWVLERAGRLDEARLHFEEALRLQSQLPPSLMGLAWILATHPDASQRDSERALELVQQGLRLLPALDSRSLDIAAAAYAAAGNYARAVELAETAVELAPGSPSDAQAIRERLALYHRGQAYRAPP